MTFRFPTNLYKCTIDDGIITISLRDTTTHVGNHILSVKRFTDELKNDNVIINDDLYLDEFIYKGKTVHNAISPSNLYKVYIDHCRYLEKTPLDPKSFSNSTVKYLPRGRTTTKDRKCLRFYIL